MERGHPKIHPTFKIGFNVWWVDSLLIKKLSQRKINPQFCPPFRESTYTTSVCIVFIAHFNFCTCRGFFLAIILALRVQVHVSAILANEMGLWDVGRALAHDILAFCWSSNFHIELGGRGGSTWKRVHLSCYHTWKLKCGRHCTLLLDVIRWNFIKLFIRWNWTLKKHEHFAKVNMLTSYSE